MIFFLKRHLIATCGILAFPLVATAADAISTVAPLTTARTQHTAALLPDGRVLVTGGNSIGNGSWPDGTGIYPAQIFDPATGTWSSAATPSVARKHATSTVLPNGKVLILGGLIYYPPSWMGNGDGTIYNPATNTWSATASMSFFRYDHVATLLQDGRVLVVGGSGGGPGQSTTLYNPTTNTWSNTGSTALYYNGGHSATLLPDGRVFVTGASYSERGSDIYDPMAGTWSAGPVGSVARHRHSATLLANGKVLIAGGGTDDYGYYPQSTASLYDPATNTLAVTGSMTTARSYHSATLLPNGKVVVMGGIAAAGGVLTSIEIYDPASGTWSTSAATLATPRKAHTSILLPDGRVMVAAGTDSSGAAISTVEIFSSTSPGWSGTGSMGAVRSQTQAVTLPDGKVLVPGGYNGGALSTAEVYNPAAGTWGSAGTMVSPHSEGTVTLMPNGKVLVAGNIDFANGMQAEVYDPVAGTWTATPNMAVARIRQSATLLPSGKVLMAGGGIASASTNTGLYDPQTNTWSTTGSLGTARNWHRATLLPDGRVLASGGTQAFAMDAYATCEVYNPATGTWSSTGTLNEKRYRHTSTLLPNGKVLVTGGMHMPSFMEVPRATAELYDPATGTWSTTGSLTNARYDHRAELLPDGRVIVAGGNSSTSVSLSSVEIYDPASGTWSAAPSMAGVRSNPGMAWLTTGKLLVAGAGSAELYDAGLGFSAESRPQVTAAAFDAGRVLTLTGSSLRGISGATGGNMQESSTAFPLVQFRSLGNAQVAWAPAASWSATSFTSSAVPNFAPGHLLLTVFTNGVPSESKVMLMPLQPEIAVEQTAGTSIADGGSQSFGSAANGTSVPLTFTIKNTGDSALAVTGASVTGGHAADFVVNSTGMSSSVAGGGSTTFTVAFTPSATGARTTTLQIFSDDNDEATYDITLTGTGLNNAPTIGDVGDRMTDEDNATPLLLFTVGDFETAAGSLTVSGSSSNTALVPNANIVFGNNGATRTVTVTPATNQTGTATITLTVSDGTASASDTFVLTVNPVNDAPTLNSISNPVGLQEDAGEQTVSLSGIGAGPNESQPVVVTATSNNVALIPHPTVTYTSGNTTGTLRYTPVPNMSGTAVITVTVDDGQAVNNTSSVTFTVFIGAVNDAPTLDALSDPATILEDAGPQSIGLSGISAGPNETQTLTVSATSNNTGLIPNPTVTYTSPNTSALLNYTPVANASGSATITVTVRDGISGPNTISRTFTVTVTAVNDAPTLNSIANPAAILEDASQQTVSLSGITAGPNETQTLSITATSDNTAVIPHPTVVYTSPSATGSLRCTPVANMSGSATITVTVNDGQATNNTITQTFTVTVNAVNDAPTLDVIRNPVAILEDAGLQTVNLTGISSGPNESQALVITAVSSNTALIPHPAVTYTTPNASLSYTPEANAHGSAIITVTVNDGQAANNTFSRTFTVTVTAVNDAPTISDIPNTGTNEDTSTGPVPLMVGDVDTGAGSLTLTGSSSNPALVPDASIIFGGSGTSRTFSITPASNQSGSAIITLTVSDGVLTASDTFELTVTAVDDAPTLSAIANQVITYNTLTNSLSFTVGDVETAAAELLVTASSSNLTLLRNSSVHLSGSGASREVVLVPEFNQTGTTTVTLSANDGAITSTTSFTLTVNAPEIVVEQPFGSNLADGGTRDFGSVPLGGTGSMVFYIRNTNAASLTGLTITKSGPNAAQFHLVAAPVSPVVGPAGNTAFTLQFIPAGIGSKTATFQIANNDPNESPFDITVTGRGTFPRPDWRQEHFGTTAENAESADLADPDRDGIANLLEYALDLDPSKASNTQVPLAQLVNDSLVLIFDEPEGVTGIDYAAEWNNTLDPASWTSAGIDHAFVNGRHTFTLPTAALGRAYMRLKVAASP